MSKQEYTGLLISDFNLDNLSGYMSHDEDSPKVSTTVSPFGQVVQTLMNEHDKCWQNRPDFAVIWTQPENVIESFSTMIQYKNASIDSLLEDVDRFSAAILNIQNRVNYIFIPTWVLPAYHRGFGMLDMKNERGISNALMRINLRLIDNLDKASDIYFLNTQKWTEFAGKNAYNPKLWYMAKTPFGNEVFKEAVKDIKSAIRGRNGNTKKLIVLDLDDTLWGGIVGDVGWENLQLGGHDYIGEAYVDFQNALKSLMNRGILLGLVSKNEESVALEAINNHPEMVLRLEDFINWKINWQDKAQNIVDLVLELNLGLESVVFIDDNPVERARVREALPEVFVPEWPEDRTIYKRTLLHLRCFDTPSITREDLERTKMYISERQRGNLKRNAGSLDEWLNSLGIRVQIEGLNKNTLQRTVQLLNKTNQLNLTTRRMSESELVEWVGQEDHKMWTFRVSDKFGDSGLTGIISFETGHNNEGKIIDFVLSCRVMGRKIEETMLYIAVEYAQSIGLNEVYAEYIQTPKNKPCLEFWQRSRFLAVGQHDHCFRWDTKNDFPLPDCIQIST